MFVVDIKPAVIKVFDKSGQMIRRIGREGEGPGEFRSAWISVLGDTLVAQDPRNSRATSFNWRTGAVITERRTACCYFFPIGIDASGAWLSDRPDRHRIPRCLTRRRLFAFRSMAHQRPAFEGVWVDASGRTWIRLGASDTTKVFYDLFDGKGRWLDVLSVPASEWPKSPWIPLALGTQEVAVPLEGDDGRPLVRVFRIERR